MVHNMRCRRTVRCGWDSFSRDDTNSLGEWTLQGISPTVPGSAFQAHGGCCRREPAGMTTVAGGETHRPFPKQHQAEPAYLDP
jgi:hypothetical protein